MTEQFGIDSAFRDGAAVDGEVGTMFAGAILVYYLRKDILAGTAFAVDKHGEVGSRHLHRHLDSAVQVRVVADNAESLLN